MITFEKQENGVLFTFENSDKYLYGSGTIEVPFNSLSIIQDESDNITLRKSASNDIFLSARYDTDFGYASKQEAVNALKEILYDEAGISEEEVQQMIDAATSGIPSSQVIEQLRTDVNAVSGEVASKADASALTAVNDALTAHTANTSIHVTSADKSNWDAKQDALTAGDYITISGNVISAENNIIELTQEEYDALVDKDPDALYIITDAQEINMNDYATKTDITDKADTSAVTAVNDALTTHTANTTIHVTSAEKTYWNNKLDASAYTPTDLSNYYTKQETNGVVNAASSGKADTSAVTAVANDVQTVSGQVATKVATTDFNTYSAATDSRLAEDEEVTAAALNDLDENKQDALVYYSENTSGKTATIHIEDTENGTQSEVVVDGASVDMYAQSNFEEEGSAIETHTDIWGNSDGIAMTYEKNIDDAEAAHCYFNVNEGLISMEVTANEETTNVDVTSTGVTINGENVATEPYVDAALSGKADTSAVTAVQQSLSGKQDTLVSGTNIKTINNESILGSGNITISGGGGQSLVYYTEDTSNESATIMVQNDDGLGNRSENRVFVDGGDIIIESYNETDDGEGNTGTTDTQVDINSLGLSIITYSDDGIDTTQTELEVQPMGAYINSEPIATEPYVNAAISGKVDTSAITTAITSGSTDAQVPSAKATYDAITAATTGGGATYSAGTNISIDTGNTISCTLNLANGTGNLSLKGGDGCTASGMESFASGYQTIADREGSAAFGKHNVSNSTGSNYFNGSNKNYLFTVGNGDSFSTRHNALEIRQNGDLYFADTDNTTYANYYQKPMVRLQDMYGALGGLKFAQVTQAQYDALVSGGTVDSSTLYIISD